MKSWCCLTTLSLCQPFCEALYFSRAAKLVPSNISEQKRNENLRALHFLIKLEVSGLWSSLLEFSILASITSNLSCRCLIWTRKRIIRVHSSNAARQMFLDSQPNHKKQAQQCGAWHQGTWLVRSTCSFVVVQRIPLALIFDMKVASLHPLSLGCTN